MLFIDDSARSNDYFFVQVYPDRSFLLYWRYKPTNEILEDHTITIYRKLYESEEYTEVTTIPANNTTFLDNYFTHNYYEIPKYALKIDDGDLTPSVSASEHPSGASLAIRRQIDINFRFAGTPTLIYQRKTRGERCPECWDACLKQVIKANCPACFGTSYTGGFFPPILTQVKFLPPKRIYQPGETLRQLEKTMAQMSYFPIVKPSDVLVHVQKGSKWVVSAVDAIEDGSCTIRQDLTIDRLNPGDIEDTLPIPKSLIPVLPPRGVPFNYAIDVTKGVKE